MSSAEYRQPYYSDEERKKILARSIPQPRSPEEIERKLIEMMNGSVRERTENPTPSIWQERGREERSMFQAGLCYALGYNQLDYIERQLAKQDEKRLSVRTESQEVKR